MARTDPLIMAAHHAIRTHGRSGKTRANHYKEVGYFVKALRHLQYGVSKWKNVSKKHVGEVVEYWKEHKRLSAATIKEYLTGVRIAAKHYKNMAVAGSTNAEFGIENQVYVTNKDKSLAEDHYSRVLENLKSGTLDQQRIAAQLELQRTLGMRLEESAKFDPNRDVRFNGQVDIADGTKGGKPRFISTVSPEARAAIEYARSRVSPKGNTMNPEKSEKQWRNYVYNQLRKLGITRKESGASCHGNRHAYAQTRYTEMTGFPPPCCFPSKEAFRENAEKTAGNDWVKLDQDARQVLLGEMGHGPRRGQTVSVYLGSVS